VASNRWGLEYRCGSNGKEHQQPTVVEREACDGDRKPNKIITNSKAEEKGEGEEAAD
jgi:hypothetical protein